MIHTMKATIIAALLAGTAFAADPSQSPSNSGQSTMSPNNTGRNEQQQTTAEDQGGSPQDRQLTSKIRSALVGNDQLSQSAKNIKVITNNGKVTLRGPVNSPQEKQSVQAIAEKFAGKKKVSNQLEVNQ